MNKDDMVDKYEEIVRRLRAFYKYVDSNLFSEAADAIEELLNVKRHESCTDCPLYDKDKHRCPRFNAVIPRVIEESQRAQCVESVGMRWTRLPKEHDRGNCSEYCYGICAYQDYCDGAHAQEFCIEQICKWLGQEVQER